MNLDCPNRCRENSTRSRKNEVEFWKFIFTLIFFLFVSVTQLSGFTYLNGFHWTLVRRCGLRSDRERTGAILYKSSRKSINGTKFYLLLLILKITWNVDAGSYILYHYTLSVYVKEVPRKLERKMAELKCVVSTWAWSQLFHSTILNWKRVGKKVKRM